MMRWWLDKDPWWSNKLWEKLFYTASWYSFGNHSVNTFHALNLGMVQAEDHWPANWHFRKHVEFFVFSCIPKFVYWFFLLYCFHLADQSSKELIWGALDDVVMGGVSESTFQIDRTGGESGKPTGLFKGLFFWEPFVRFSVSILHPAGIRTMIYKPLLWLHHLFAPVFLFSSSNYFSLCQALFLLRTMVGLLVSELRYVNHYSFCCFEVFTPMFHHFVVWCSVNIYAMFVLLNSHKRLRGWQLT